MPTALITGATAGLGATFARHLAAEGHDLVIVARDEARLQSAQRDLRARYSVTVEVIAADLATDAGTARVAERLGASPIVDVLVNNAGIGLYAPFGTAELAADRALLDLNVTAVLTLSHAAVRAMTARGAGTIINVASVSGFVPRGGSATYSASKAWVIAFTEGLALRLEGTGVRAAAICPGFVHTEFHDRANVETSAVPKWMWLDADAVVAAGLADVRRGKPVSIPGARYKVMVGASRLMGTRLVRRIGNSGGPRPR